MLLPQVLVRKIWLAWAMTGYPLYDPPHKVEEYLLSKAQAKENFDYFMGVRHQRLVFFQNWLLRYFRIEIKLDGSGMSRLNRWGNKYAGLLLDRGPAGRPTRSYFTYDPPWTGENVGYNILFDMGITFGEIVIANCPRLHWELEPTAAILPRTAKMLKRSPGTSFQKPKLTGFDDPVAELVPLNTVYVFAHQMSLYTISFKGALELRSCPPDMRKNILEQLLNSFTAALRYYPAGDPQNVRNWMPPEEYLKFVDEVEAQEGNDNG